MPHSNRVLDDAALAFFRAHNYVALDDCLPRALAERWTRDALAHRGINLDDRSTWPNPDDIHFLSRMRPADRVVDLRDLVPRAWQAACELVGGEDRLESPAPIDDHLVMNFGLNADQPYVQPAQRASGWHVDGDYNHFLDSPESGLMMLINFSDIVPRGGDTWIAPDAIGPIARTLLDHPQGLSACVLNRDHNPYPHCRNFVSLAGPIGRVFLMHPLMLHTVSANPLRRARAMRNASLRLRQPMQFDPARRPLSEIERATLAALGRERLDFTPPEPSQRFPTDHDTGAALPLKAPQSDAQRRARITLDAAALANLAQPVHA